jgi:hypothetical protein
MLDYHVILAHMLCMHLKYSRNTIGSTTPRQLKCVHSFFCLHAVSIVGVDLQVFLHSISEMPGRSELNARLSVWEIVQGRGRSPSLGLLNASRDITLIIVLESIYLSALYYNNMREFICTLLL